MSLLCGRGRESQERGQWEGQAHGRHLQVSVLGWSESFSGLFSSDRNLGQIYILTLCVSLKETPFFCPEGEQ